MSALKETGLDRAAVRLLTALATGASKAGARTPENAARALLAADLACRDAGGTLRITQSGRAHLARLAPAPRTEPAVSPFVRQHCRLEERDLVGDGGRARVLVNETESPLAWLARRKGKHGQALIEPHQFLAGERLRADFTLAQMMPRTTSNWESPVASGRRAGGAEVTASDTMVAARQRLQRALEASGPEFSGLLLDVCCFLKRLEESERERRWPPRSAKIVLQLGLERLARHYGLSRQTRGPGRAKLSAWRAPEAVAETVCAGQ